MENPSALLSFWGAEFRFQAVFKRGLGVVYPGYPLTSISENHESLHSIGSKSGIVTLCDWMFKKTVSKMRLYTCICMNKMLSILLYTKKE